VVGPYLDRGNRNARADQRYSECPCVAITLNATTRSVFVTRRSSSCPRRSAGAQALEWVSVASRPYALWRHPPCLQRRAALDVTCELGKALFCEECGCVSGDGRGWIGQIAFDPEDGLPPNVVVFCLPCAASEFGYRPDIAAS
jgi:hypothetical protein